jgi:hypothetical protein
MRRKMFALFFYGKGKYVYPAISNDPNKLENFIEEKASLCKSGVGYVRLNVFNVSIKSSTPSKIDTVQNPHYLDSEDNLNDASNFSINFNGQFYNFERNDNPEILDENVLRRVDIKYLNKNYNIIFLITSEKDLLDQITKDCDNEDEEKREDAKSVVTISTVKFNDFCDNFT